MLDHIKQEGNMTLTENGAATYLTSGSDCLDLFATVGALRHASDEEIISRFICAYTENPVLAMKLLFFARDIRGGLGERRVFRTIFAWLAKNEPDSVKKNIKYVADYGRFDDLLALIDTPCEKEMFEFLKSCLDSDLVNINEGENISLLAKWLPSINTSDKRVVYKAKKLAKAFGMNSADYRKVLSRLRAKIQIIENNLRKMDYSFDYEKQPSRAMYKYKKAFLRNDEDRYSAFLSKVVSGEAKLHADNISPYELVEPYLIEDWRRLKCDGRFYMKTISEAEKAILNTTWNSIPDFGKDENSIAVIDTSASMYYQRSPLPAAVALSLGLYFAERNKGIFKNHFIEFSNKAQLIEIKGETFADRLRYIATFCKVASTNLESVFNLILNAAKKYNVSQDEMPKKLVIISDMEFNSCVENPDKINFYQAKQRYEGSGYKLPEIIFWNVASRNRQQPVTMNEQGVVLVSGATPRIFSMVAGGKTSPYTFMLEVLNSERYMKIAA